MTEPQDDNFQRRLTAIGHDLIRLAHSAPVGIARATIAADADADLVAFARQLLRERRLRERFFDPKLFADPVWDLLLDLFVADQEQRDISISSASIAANVASTTALRYIAHMVEVGMLVRRADPADHRRVLVALHPNTSARVEAYLMSVSQARSTAVD